MINYIPGSKAMIFKEQKYPIKVRTRVAHLRRTVNSKCLYYEFRESIFSILKTAVFQTAVSYIFFIDLKLNTERIIANTPAIIPNIIKRELLLFHHAPIIITSIEIIIIVVQRAKIIFFAIITSPPFQLCFQVTKNSYFKLG